MFKKPDYATPDQIDWVVTFTIITIHVLAGVGLATASVTFSWPAVLTGIIVGYITGSMGISFCYHRLLTHSGFKTTQWMTYLTTAIACLNLEGGPIFWTSTHRYHHKQSDKRFDPHSPRDGFMWAHMGWLFYNHPVLAEEGAREKITADLAADPGIMWLERNNALIGLGQYAVLFAIGYAMGGLTMGWSFFFWAGVIRTVWVWHTTWLINSATHLVGYRNHATEEDSTNFPLIALFSFGEGWHNNHHGDPLTPIFWHRWFEFDSTYVAIWLLQRVGLVWDVVEPRHKRLGITLPVPNAHIKPAVPAPSAPQPA